MTTAETQVWRVVCEGGEVREVAAVYAAEVSAWAATGEATLAMGDVVRAINATARRAVMSYAMRAHWPVVEIVAPGVLTAAERLAQVTAGRDAAVTARDALVTAVREERRARYDYDEADIAFEDSVGTLDEFNDAARDLSAAEAATTSLLTATPVAMVRVEVVRAYLAATDAIPADGGAVYAARDALDAALAAAGGAR